MPGFLAGLWALLGGRGGPSPPQDDPIERARAGDPAAREQVLRQYTPLVLRVGAQVTGRYLEPGRDEEVSVGLMALDEAIDRYAPGRGASFLTFAEVVIRRRLIDHLRRARRRPEVPLSSLAPPGEESSLPGADERAAVLQHRADEEAAERREEIERLSRRLLEFGIRFEDLVRESPRHEDARQRAIACARLLAEDPDLREHLLLRKELPLRQLAGRAPVSRKTLERQRRYIVAVAIILLEEYDYLRSYIRPALGPDGGGPDGRGS